MKKQQDPAVAASEAATAGAADTMPAPTQEPTEATAPETDEYSEILSEAKKVIVVGVYPGTGDIVEKIFKDVPEDVTVVYAEATDTERNCLVQLIAEAISDPALPEEFIVVPTGCVPCGGVDLDAMRLSTVYVDRNGNKKYDNGLPMVIRKSDALEVFDELETLCDDSTDPAVVSETFAKIYVQRHRPRPTAVSFLHGNYVTPANRANPCEHRVIEALLQKKFITSNFEGFKAIIPVLEKSLK